MRSRGYKKPVVISRMHSGRSTPAFLRHTSKKPLNSRIMRTKAEKLDAMATAIMVKCDGYGRITRGQIMKYANVTRYDFDELITDVPFVVNQRSPGWTAVIEQPAHTTVSGKKLDCVWLFTP